MKEYVFIGFSGLFGEYADLIHGHGGRIKKLVINLPLETTVNHRPFSEVLQRHLDWRKSIGIEEPIEIEQLRAFSPDSSDNHVLACRGPSIRPLQRYLTETLGISFPPLVHSTAVISPTSVLAQGTIIHSQVFVGSNVVIGEFCSIKPKCYIGHDSTVGDYVDLSPAAIVASSVTLEDEVGMGINSSVINDLKLGRNCFVAAGAVVTANVSPFTLVAGVPAVPKKTIEPRKISEVILGLP